MDAVAIERLDVAAYCIPTDRPESDGTLQWGSTTIVIVEAQAGGLRSLGSSHADRATAQPIEDKRGSIVVGRDALSPRGLRRAMMDDNHWAPLGVLGEILPAADNRVTLSDERDRFGLRIPHIHFSLQDNDRKLIAFAKDKVEEVMRAAGATEIAQESRFAHLVGAARMGSDLRTSVVDKFGRTHDVANLFVCDGSIMPSQGSANPGLTIQSLAARCADYLIAQGDAVFHSKQRDLTAPPVRRYLSPPGTHGKGVRI